MSVPTVKFNINDRPEFFKELRSRVNQHFKDNKITRYANTGMKIKTVFMLSLYFVPLILLMSGLFTSNYAVYLMWALMGFGMSGIGLSVMHDANHGSYSTNQKVNNALGFVLNFVGGYHINWKIQHNVLHHSFTNVHGFDEDIENNLIRMSPNKERKPMHRFQIIYGPLLYGLMTFYWIVSKDFEQIFRYDKKNLLASQGLTLKKALLQVSIYKLLYVVSVLVLPFFTTSMPWYVILSGFFMMHFICGIVLAFIFQPAHVVEETSFFKTDETGSVENNWAIHQMKTTSNFANKARAFSWFVGGLNYQVEHHLFPNICHVHYRDISPIVKATAQEYGVPYHEYETFRGALKSHFGLLYELGTGKYDQKLSASVA